eukprot:76514_1
MRVAVLGLKPKLMDIYIEIFGAVYMVKYLERIFSLVDMVEIFGAVYGEIFDAVYMVKHLVKYLVKYMVEYLVKYMVLDSYDDHGGYCGYDMVGGTYSKLG